MTPDWLCTETDAPFAEAVDELERACMDYARCLHGVVSLSYLAEFRQRRDAARAAVLARGPMPLLEALQDRPEMPPPVLRSDKRVAAPRCPTCDGSGVVSPAMSGRVSMSIGPCPDCAPPTRGAS